ncbi:MAG TPA: hypothetical protein VKB69_10410 [Micromonosporaceae bacterium]|nr:hypothetical protein [Micromonosporaceae bacterium]
MVDIPGPVVVGTSTDATSTDAAIEVAAGEARRRHVDLRLVCGSDALAPWATGDAYAQMREPTGHTIDRTVSRVARSCPGVVVTCAVYPGDPVKAVIAAAQRASLVVLDGDDQGRYRDVLAAVPGQVPVIVVMVPRPAGTAADPSERAAPAEAARELAYAD